MGLRSTKRDLKPADGVKTQIHISYINAPAWHKLGGGPALVKSIQLWLVLATLPKAAPITVPVSS